MTALPDFKIIAAEQRSRLTPGDVDTLVERGRRFGDLSSTLDQGGAILFPHVGIAVGGHQTAAAVQAALGTHADTVLVLGVLHARSQELEDARVRVAAGEDPAREASWGIQGPGVPGRQDWKNEFSLDHFLFLWEEIARCLAIRRVPRLVMRFPFLAGGHPERLPGIGELERLLEQRGTVVLATGDLFHHGMAYGTPSEEARTPESGGLDLARAAIGQGFALLGAGDYWGYNQHSVTTKSDARDVGQVLGHLLGHINGRILDLVAEDMTGPYQKPAPSWVAGALVACTPSRLE
jgi:hypothetical protein